MLLASIVDNLLPPQVLTRAEELKADVQKGVFVCGTSAGEPLSSFLSLTRLFVELGIGGNISAAITYRARDDPSFKWKIGGQILIMPNTYSKRLHPLERRVGHSSFGGRIKGWFVNRGARYKDDLTSYDEYVNDPVAPRGLLDLSDGRSFSSLKETKTSDI